MTTPILDNQQHWNSSLETENSSTRISVASTETTSVAQYAQQCYDAQLFLYWITYIKFACNRNEERTVNRKSKLRKFSMLRLIKKKNKVRNNYDVKLKVQTYLPFWKCYSLTVLKSTYSEYKIPLHNKSYTYSRKTNKIRI